MEQKVDKLCQAKFIAADSAISPLQLLAAGGKASVNCDAMSLSKDDFNSISASLHAGKIEDYYYIDWCLDTEEEQKKSEKKAVDLDNLTVPEFGSKITLTAGFFGMGGPDETFEAANGTAFTVRELFDAIAKYESKQRYGPSDHVFFEGLEPSGRKPGCYSVMWGS